MNLMIARIKANLTQKALSNKAGVSVVTIVKIEKGKIDGVKIITLKKLAKALNSTVEELFFSKE